MSDIDPKTAADDLFSAAEKAFDEKRTRLMERVREFGSEFVTAEMLEKDPDQMSDLEAAVIAFGWVALHLVEITKWPPTFRTCGWCVAAAGNTRDAAEAAVRYTEAEISEHITSCGHNPLVPKLARAEATIERIREAVPMVDGSIPGDADLSVAIEDIVRAIHHHNVGDGNG